MSFANSHLAPDSPLGADDYFLALPRWIAPAESWPIGEARCFRKVFESDRPAQSVRLIIAAAEEFTAYLNGKRIGSGAGRYQTAVFELSGAVGAGKNCLAIEVVKQAEDGGLIAEGCVSFVHDCIPIRSDETWKAGTSAPDWQSVDFDDSNWANAAAGLPDPRFGPSLAEREEQLRRELQDQPLRLPWPQPCPERLVAQTFRGGDPVWKDVYELRRVLRGLKAHGFNMISLDIRWADVEREPGKYDFSAYDVRFHEILRQGFYIQIRFWFLSHPSDPEIPSWIAKRQDWFKRCADGRMDKNASLTYASAELNAMKADLCRAAAEHYRNYPNVCFSFASSEFAEVEYAWHSYEDYSPPAQRQFRQWLAGEYADVAALNAAWKCAYRSFNEVSLPIPAEPLPDGQFDFTPPTIDFFCYREFAVDNYSRILVGAIREGDPNAEVALTIGHALSPECVKRNTISTFRWLKHYDWLWIDPAPRDNYPMRLAVGRGAFLMGKKLAVEVDGLHTYIRCKTDLCEALPRHTAESFRGGAAMMTTANWSFAGYGPGPDRSHMVELAEAQREMAAYVGEAPAPARLPAREAIYFSKWTAFASLGNARAWDAATDLFDRLYSQSERHIDIVTDDVFVDDPQVLRRYTKIHVPSYAPVVSQAAREALIASGVEIVADREWGRVDELGRAF